MLPKIKIIYILFFLFFFSKQSFAQFELPKKTLRIAPIPKSSGEVAPTAPKSINYPSIFDKKDKLLEGISILKPKPQEEKSVFENEQFDSSANEYTNKMNDLLKSEGLKSVVENSDSYLGEFITTTTQLQVTCRDYGAIDGDKVSVWLNGQLVVPLIYLESGYKKYVLELKEGANEIKIEALNTGELFPNTGQFGFQDANNKVITNQQWVLNTGYNAIIKIRKIKGPENLEEKQ